MQRKRKEPAGPLQPTTFGAFPAAINLASILSEMPWAERDRLQRKVATLLGRYGIGLQQINTIIDEPTRAAVLTVWRDHFLRGLNRDRGWPPKVTSHVDSVIKTHYKRYLRGEVPTGQGRR